jgi:Stress responsive A/B Barrel Domain
MIRPVVMWSVRGEDAAAQARNARFVKDEFSALRGRVPGLVALDVGVDESRVDYACEVVLIADFSSRQALADYAAHPEHLRVRGRLGDLRSARHQVDYEVADHAPER